VFLDRLNRKNIGARSTGKALYQMCHEIGINVIHTFDIEIFSSLDLTMNIDSLEELFMKSAENDEKLSKLLRQLQNADMLIINGEGSYIFSANFGAIIRGFAVLMKIAKEAGVRTYLLNTEAAPASDGTYDVRLVEDFKRTMKYVDLFTVRSKRSLEFAQRYLSTKAIYVPDALFSWIKYFEQGLEKPLIGDSIIPFPDSNFSFGTFDFSKPYICISDSSALDTTSWVQFVPSYVELINRLKESKPEYRIYLVETGAPGKPFLDEISKQTNTTVIPVTINLLTMQAILGNAELFISGRWHPSIMAVLNGTPCILTDANCHKMDAFEEMMELSLQARTYSAKLDNPKDIDAIVENCIAVFEKKGLRQAIRAKAMELSLKSLDIKKLIKEDIEKNA